MPKRLESDQPIPEPDQTPTFGLLSELVRDVLSQVPELGIPGTTILFDAKNRDQKDEDVETTEQKSREILEELRKKPDQPL
jgi:hypothetical protein